jgi:subtilase family serine protease
MYRILSAGVFTAGIVFAGTALAAPQSLQLSGNTYHVAACPGAIPLRTARCFARVVTDRAGNEIVHAVSLAGTPSGYGPTQLRLAYAVTGSGSSSTTVAVVDADGYSRAEADLAIYRSQYGLPACTTANGCFAKYNQSGGTGSYPKDNTGWAQETALDLDMVSAMCPGCKIVLVEANSASFANLAAAENTAAAKGAHVISNSYGGAESGSQTYEPSYNHVGVAITVSTGDSGYGTQFPATSPHVTAVGGTHLVTDSSTRGWKETVWSGGGSGCSVIYAKPTWQTDSGCAKRMEADVSAVADPNTGVAVYGPTHGPNSGWLVFGGTSVAAPLVGGVYGVNGGAVSSGSNPYGATTALNDVTSGSNGSCPTNYWCNAGVGYDGPTGLGTPKGVTAF